MIGWLAQCQTSIILLSATLPKVRRKELMRAFQPTASVPEDVHCPSVIGVDSTGKIEVQMIEGLEPDTIHMVPVVAAPEEKSERIVSLLAEKLIQGGCGACVLNTVGEAQMLYALVKQEIPSIEDVILFHSRFTLGRKLEAFPTRVGMNFVIR